jgi:uncharacterized membrane protein
MILNIIIVIVLIGFGVGCSVFMFQAWRAGKDLQKELDDIRKSRKGKFGNHDPGEWD